MAHCDWSPTRSCTKLDRWKSRSEPERLVSDTSADESLSSQDLKTKTTEESEVSEQSTTIAEAVNSQLNTVEAKGDETNASASFVTPITPSPRKRKRPKTNPTVGAASPIRRNRDHNEEYKDKKQETEEKIIVVGCKLVVYWPDEDVYYSGVAVKRNVTTGQVQVRYVDGEEEWLHWSCGRVVVLTEKNTLSGVYRRRPDNPSLDRLQVGTRLLVWWPAEQQFFPGSIKEICVRKLKLHYIEYDDGDKEWMNLYHRLFQYLDDP